MTGLSDAHTNTKRARGVDDHITAMRSRRDRFLALHDFSVGRGLEIGPLDSGLADPETDRVTYVDVLDTTGLREHYAHDPNVILELIPQIDYPLQRDGVMQTLADAASPGAPYDWVIASHVIEHVPDVIGWLAQVAELTVDDGVLLLAVPDRRYTFDRHRPPTTTGQAIQAHDAGDTRPSIRAVYDYFTSAVTVDPGKLWAGAPPPGRSARMHDEATVRSMMERCRAGEYVDCHVWTYTPQSLVDQVDELRALGLCEWYVEKVAPVPHGIEFYALLRRLPADVPTERIQCPSHDPASDMPDWLFDEWSARDEVRRQRRRIRRLERRLEDLQRSVRFRIGTAVVAPLSRIRGSFRGRRRGEGNGTASTR